jgi:HEPN domain-containing protein
VLAPIFARTRYPSGRVDEPIPARLVQAEDAQAAISAAEEAMAWVRDLLQEPPGRARRKTRF